MNKIHELAMWIVAIVILVFFISGISGLKLLFILVVIFVLPVYYVLCQFFPDIKEKIIISLFLSLGIIPSLTYALGFLVGIKKASIASACILTFIGLLLQIFYNRKNEIKNVPNKP
jgi:phosphoglycerol transferase MdoB-like AlkP superfamily enzyme